jgi:hypothetical protein
VGATEQQQRFWIETFALMPPRPVDRSVDQPGDHQAATR